MSGMSLCQWTNWKRKVVCAKLVTLGSSFISGVVSTVKMVLPRTVALKGLHIKIASSISKKC